MPRAYLQVLNLSNNLFDGKIPDPHDFLAYPRVLDLSNNKFSGEIPTIIHVF